MSVFDSPLIDEVVTLWVESPPQSLASVLHGLANSRGERIALGGGDELQLEGGFERSSDRALPTWRAPARLLWHGPKLVRVARVEVDVTAWRDDAAEVSVRPAGRRVLSWGHRRERRYFESAHRAATHLAHAVAAPNDESPFETTSAA
jgi:hypothetical protein